MIVGLAMEREKKIMLTVKHVQQLQGCGTGEL